MNNVLTKEEYCEKLIAELFHAYKECELKACRLAVNDEAQAQELAEDEIKKRIGLNIYEEAWLDNNNLDEAYGAYRALNNSKEHTFDIDFHYTVYVNTQVYAETEDDAKDYVKNNLSIDTATNFADSDKLAGAVVFDDYGEGVTFDGVEDLGEAED